MIMINRPSSEKYADQLVRIMGLIGILSLLIGCDSSSPPLAVETVPDFTGELILVEDAPASSGNMSITLEIAPPDMILEPTEPVGGGLTPKTAADIHFEAQIRYSGAVLGGKAEGEFVPYLNVNLKLTNRDTGKSLDTTLVPHVGIAEGFHYARNIALVDTLKASEAGYDAKVTITAPVQAGSSQQTTISPGIAMRSDIAPAHERAGSVFGLKPVIVTGGFLLGDFKTIGSGKGGTGGGEAGEVTLPPTEEATGGAYQY